jgi:peptidoglycan-associated lipoprotein
LSPKVYPTGLRAGILRLVAESANFIEKEMSCMNKNQLRNIFVVTILSTLLVLAGCSRKEAKVTPPAPAPPPSPNASLTATPTSIERGQSAELTWHTQNATNITISGLGTVSASGSRAVSPADSTTYHLDAKGPGGTAESSARITVAAPSAPAVSQMSLDELFASNVKDVFFDFNMSSIRGDEQSTASTDAQFLRQHPELKVTVEGHCDDRGSEEYNLGLGDRRAETVKAYLVQAGISADRIRTISYGKEKPFCRENDEQCWQQNRRDHFARQQ